MTSQTESAKSSSSPANCAALTPNTISDLLQKIADIPQPKETYFLSSRGMKAVRYESITETETPPVISTLLGLPLMVMPDQKSDCIIIGDAKIAEAYRDGVISEKLLLSIMQQHASVEAAPETKQNDE